MMKHWMSDVVACSDGTEVSAKAIRKLERFKIPLRSEPIRSLKGANGELARIVFESGPELPRARLFFRPAAIRHRIYQTGWAASVVRKGVWSLIPHGGKQCSRRLCCG